MPFEIIHVAGTNGKGSVCTKIAASLQLAGRRVGLFTSPHILTSRERIQVNGEKIPYELPPNFAATFEIAMRYFAEERVDIAVIETGIGGRLDATNVVDPILSIITSIGFDHMDRLGNTLEEIGREKAGIIKPGVPVILGPSAHFIGGDILVPAQPDFLAENVAIARAALEHLGVPPIGLDAMPPCRFERHGNFLLDVAHNPAGVRALRQLIDEPARFLLGTSPGKDRAGMLAELEGLPVQLVEIGNLKEHFDPRPDDLLVICGSCYLMAEALQMIEGALSR